MDRYPYFKPPQWWEPRPHRLWVRCWWPVRLFQERRLHRLAGIDVHNLEAVEQSIREGHGILITPNHASHSDCYLVLEALLRLNCPSYIMTAWQVFYLTQRWQQLAYQHHGCFSVDREGRDLHALRFATRTLARTSHPLVIFPEGEVYHLNDYVTPFRDGTFMVASSAVKCSGRPVACHPCALKYHYVGDPTRELLEVVERLEGRLDMQPDPVASLASRVERIQEATLSLRENQYLGDCLAGNPAARRDHLADTILARLERRLNFAATLRTIPERVTTLRQHLIEQGAVVGAKHAPPQGDEAEMEDLHVAVQLYSYRFGYVTDSPTIERIAETVDKLEEDLLGARTASIRGRRRATVTMGDPVLFERPLDRDGCRRFGETIRHGTQALLESHGQPSPPQAVVQPLSSQAGSSSRVTSKSISRNMR